MGLMLDAHSIYVEHMRMKKDECVNAYKMLRIVPGVTQILAIVIIN